MKILMVCLGNICRSPLAEGILKQKIEQEGLDWEVDSAGTSNYHAGEGPDNRSITVGSKYGIDISTQHSRQFRRDDFKMFDKIYVMDSSNYQNVVKLAESEVDKAKVNLIMNEVQANRNINVPDPYWGNDGFEQVYQMLDEACNKIVEHYTALT
ncbi:MAG: low molecular weight phosphotyrosine protein phosphatase [Saprospiraceae bacterium]|nr:low molecular weight phosphotyrosine protein phosphatase [Saprospiraceae bacterium]